MSSRTQAQGKPSALQDNVINGTVVKRAGSDEKTSGFP
jgi:hypothetical protein